MPFPFICIFSVILVHFSGYGIAAQGLAAVMKAYDGRGPKTMLTHSVLESLGLSSPDEVIGYLNFEFRSAFDILQINACNWQYLVMC